MWQTIDGVQMKSKKSDFAERCEFCWSPEIRLYEDGYIRCADCEADVTDDRFLEEAREAFGNIDEVLIERATIEERYRLRRLFKGLAANSHHQLAEFITALD